MWTKKGYYGTGSFKVLLDIDKFKDIENKTTDQEFTKSTDLTHEPIKNVIILLLKIILTTLKVKNGVSDGDDYMPDDL